MSKQLKPVIRYSHDGNTITPDHFSIDTAYLCIPLTPASRKAMIEAMAKEMAAHGDSSVMSDALCAFAALEKMAGDAK